MKKRRLVLQPMGWEPLIYRQSGCGPGKRTPWKSSDQPTRGHVTVETHRSLDAGCMKYQDNLTSLDAGCMKHQDNLTSLDAECITWWDCQDNLTCLDVKTVKTILIVLTGQHYIV